MFTDIGFVEVWVWKEGVTLLITDTPCLFYAETVLLPKFDFLMGLFIFFSQGD